MANTQITLPLSTDAKVLINDWQTIRKIIRAHTTLLKKKNATSETPSLTTLFSDREISDALEGPNQTFFKEKLAAYAMLGKLRLALTVTDSDENSTSNKTKTTGNPSLDRFLEKTTINDVNKIQNDLDTLVKKHDEEWQEQLKEWDTLLIASCAEHNIPLTEHEQTELRDKEPLSELLGRFSDLNLTPPELNTDKLTYTQYLKLKLELIILSSLSRRQQSHTNADIRTAMKKFTKIFKQIKQQETEQIERQRTETKKIIYF